MTEYPDANEDDLSIEFSSVFELEKILKQHSVTEARYQKAFAEAAREVDTLTLQVAILSAEIVNEMIAEYVSKAGKPFPITGRGELRKMIPLDKRYQKVMKRLIEATFRLNTFKGLSFTWGHRSTRLEELSRFANRTMFDGLEVRGDRMNNKVSRVSGMVEE